MAVQVASMAKKPRKPPADPTSLIRSLNDSLSKSLEKKGGEPAFEPSVTLPDATQLIGKTISALQAPASRTDSPQAAPATLADLLGHLSLRQEQLAKEIFQADSLVSSLSSSGDSALVTGAMLRIQGTIVHELRSLSEPDQQLLLKRLLVEITKSIVKPSSAPAMPLTAPEQWEARQPGNENPVQFVRRVYATWIGRGLSRRQLRNLDPALYRAFSVWTHRHPEDAMAELPSMSEETDSIIEALSHQMSVEDLRRLGYAIDQRIRRLSKSKTE